MRRQTKGQTPRTPAWPNDPVRLEQEIAREAMEETEECIGFAIGANWAIDRSRQEIAALRARIAELEKPAQPQGDPLENDFRGISQFYGEQPQEETQEEWEVGQIIDERDDAEEWGVKLAEAISEYFRVPVGEHSSSNDPRQVALEILGGGYKTDSDSDRQIAALRAARDEARYAPIGDNHHNAAVCPYCYRDRLLQIEEARTLRQQIEELQGALLEAVKTLGAAEDYMLRLRKMIYAGKPEVRERATAEVNDFASSYQVLSSSFCALPAVREVR